MRYFKNVLTISCLLYFRQEIQDIFMDYSVSAKIILIHGYYIFAVVIRNIPKYPKLSLPYFFITQQIRNLKVTGFPSL